MEACEFGSRFSRVVLMKSTQTGGSEGGLNFAGRNLAYGLGPGMIVLPKAKHARAFSRKRVSPLIDHSDLKYKILSTNERDKDNSLMEKRFPNASLFIAGCSKDDLRSDPIRWIVFEEVSNFPKDVDGQGDPVDLAWNRTKTFIGSRKGLFISTPTIRGVCRITKEWENSNKSYYNVPCPHCKGMQALVWEQVTYDPKSPLDAKYKCIHCEALIDHSHKSWMLKHGEWLATVPEETETAGFHISALYSPVGLGDTWGGLAKMYEEIGDDLLKKKDFWNNYLGLPFEVVEEQVEWDTLYNRREYWDQEYLPEDVLYLTMGVDCQKNYLAYEIVGWTQGLRSYSIEYDTIEGDTATDEPWDLLLEVLARKFEHPYGSQIGISKTGIDTGFNSAYVYKFLRRVNSRHVHGVDGRDGEADYLVGSPSHVDKTVDGKRTFYGLKVWPVGTHVIKSELFGWFRLRPNSDGSYPAGYCHFPHTHSAEYFKELTAEEIDIETDRHDRDKLIFRKIRKRNEALDCRVYARAMAYLLGLDRMTPMQWEARRENLNSGENDE